MNPRASELISLLELEPYEEGGYFRETFRSSVVVHLSDGRGDRKGLTSMYYMLAAGEHDTWHRVSSDEVWHYHEGAPLELIWLEPRTEVTTRCILGEAGGLTRPAAVVPGGCWQMARTMGEYTLVGCTVGPGFELDDYRLMRDLPEEASDMGRRFPRLTEFLFPSR